MRIENLEAPKDVIRGVLIPGPCSVVHKLFCEGALILKLSFLSFTNIKPITF